MKTNSGILADKGLGADPNGLTRPDGAPRAGAYPAHPRGSTTHTREGHP